MCACDVSSCMALEITLVLEYRRVLHLRSPCCHTMHRCYSCSGHCPIDSCTYAHLLLGPMAVWVSELSFYTGFQEKEQHAKFFMDFTWGRGVGTQNFHVYHDPASLSLSQFLSCSSPKIRNRFFSTEFCERLISRFFWIPYSLCFKKLIKCLPNTFSSLPGKMMINSTFFITLYSGSKSPTVIGNFQVRSSRFHSLFKSPLGGKKNRTQSSS